jgi:hypothetical protein
MKPGGRLIRFPAQIQTISLVFGGSFRALLSE